MTPTAIRERISEVVRVSAAHDHERAHKLEAELLADVLGYIALESPSNAGELAGEALAVKRVQFPRWYS
jgi:hypothetical protein